MQKKQKSVVLVVDNPVRDLPSLIILASELIKRGMKVCLTPFYGVGNFVARTNPNIVVLNYARPNNINLIKKLKSKGIQVCVLDTEGGIFSNTGSENTYEKTVIKDSSVRGLISKYFVWGEKLYKLLRDKEIYTEDQLLLTGTPRFDTYSGKYKTFINGRKEHNYILITGSFPTVNSKFQSVEVESKMLIEKFNYEPEYVERLVKNLTSGLRLYVEKVCELAKTFPDVDIVYRPHPFEKDSYYDDKFRDYPNIKLIKEGVIAEWIYNAFALIHFESSCALDAVLMNKPCFAFEFSKVAFNIEDIDAITDRFDDNWLDTVKACLNGNYAEPEQVKTNKARVIRDILYKEDGNSASRIAAALDELPINENTHANKMVMEIVKPVIKSALGKYDTSKKYTVEDVTGIISRLNIVQQAVVKHSLGEFRNIEIK